MKWLTAFLLALAAVLGGLLLFRQVAPGIAGGEALDIPKPLPAVALLNDRGEPTTLAAGDGRMRLVFYGFVRCPDVCPATLAALKNVYAALPADQQSKVQVQFITVDPAFDRPNVVRAYLDKFDPAFTGLTGTSEAINTAAKEMFVGIVNNGPPAEDHSAHTGQAEEDDATPATAAAARDTAAEDTGVSAAQAAIIHGDQVSVVDAQGRFVRVYGNQAVIGGELERDLPGLIRRHGS